MPKQTVERVFSRRAFVFFLLVAPAAVLTLFVIILATQYRQLQAVVSSRAEVTAFGWKPADRARLDTVLASVHRFASGTGSDTLRFSAPDLTLLAAASPLAQKQGIHVLVTAADSLLVVQTTQSIEDQKRGLSWIFKKIVPLKYQYLNARLEGLPQWKEQRLDFIPDNGSLNGAKVPRAALLKRAGMSPRDFIDDAGLPTYQELLNVLDTTYFAGGAVTLVRRHASDSASAGPGQP